MRHYRVLWTMAVAGLLMLVLPGCASALTLKAQYDTPTCAEPMTFTLTSDGTSDCLYALSGVSRAYTDDNERVLVVDPSLGGYKTKFTKENVFTIPLRTSGSYYLKFNVMDKGTTPISTASVWVNFTINEKGYPTAEALADGIAAECLKTCSTDFEKALWLHDWLVTNSDYDYSYSFCSADAALTGNKGTCESYHRAYEMLLRRVGVQSARVVGNGHVWTNVQIDGRWCQVDVTWDDMGDSYKGTIYEHLYFGLTDELMATAHDEHTTDTARRCDTLANNYFIRTGKVSEWTTSVLSGMKAARETTGTLSTYMAPSTKKIIYPIICEDLLGRGKDGRTIISAVYDAESEVIRCEMAAVTALPKGLLVIGDGAFEGIAGELVTIPSGATTIGARAFAGCEKLMCVDIPDSVTRIAADAFSGSTSVRFICSAGSTAYTYATAHDIPVTLR